MLNKVAIMLLGLVIAGACSAERIDAPLAQYTGIVLTPGDSGRVYFLDSSLTTVTTLALGIRAQLGATMSPDHRTLYLANVLPDDRHDFVAIDLVHAAIQWREPASGPNNSRSINGMEVWAADLLSITPDGSRLVTGVAIRDGIQGIATLDVATRTEARFAGPFVANGGIEPLPPSMRFPGGSLVLVGTRRPRDRSMAIFFLDPTTLAVQDSLTAVLDEVLDTLVQVLPVAGGEVLLLGGRRMIARYDLVSRRVTASVRKPTSGGFALNADGRVLVLADQGQGPDSPGTGQLTLFDAATLAPLGAITLPPVGGMPRRISNASPSRNPAIIYVTTGARAPGILFTPQPAELFSVDAITRTIVHERSLQDWGGAQAFWF